MAGPSEWLRFYRQGFAGEEPPPSPTSSGILGRGISDSTPVVTSVSTPGTGNSTGGSSSTVHLNPEGRVAKPSRRRSRASRRAPTTLLNTDTTNFRAMVQQFTGIPSAPFNTGPQTGTISNFNFGVGGGQEHHLNTATTMAPGGYNLHQQQQPQPQRQFQHHQQPQQQQQQQPQHQFQQQQLQYMLSMKDTTSDVFRQRFRDGNQ